MKSVHVAFVGRIAVKHPRTNASLCCFRLHHCKRNVAKTHAAYFFWHMWKPQSGFDGLVTKLNQIFDVGSPHLGLHLVPMTIWLHRRLNDVVDKVADLLAYGFMFWSKCEIDHLASPLLTLSSFILMPRDQ